MQQTLEQTRTGHKQVSTSAFSLSLQVTFWIGAVLNLAFGYHVVASWVGRRLEMEHIHAAWIMPTVGAFVVALVGPTLAAAYREAAYLW